MNALLLTGQTSEHITYVNNLSSQVGIHTGMCADWLAMQTQAKLDGIELSIASGFRDFERQLSIWNRKFSGELATKNHQNDIVDLSSLTDADKIHAIMLYSALPGASRHHWGCDIDVYDQQALGDNALTLSPWEYAKNGPFEHLSTWLKQHSKSFGFYFPYDTYRHGIAAEPWHLSYAPLSQMFEQHLTIDMLAHAIESADIQGKQTLLSILPDLYSRYITNVGKPTS